MSSRRTYRNWPALIIGSLLTITLALVTTARYGELFGDARIADDQNRAGKPAVSEALSEQELTQQGKKEQGVKEQGVNERALANQSRATTSGVSRMLGFFDHPNGSVEIVDIEQNNRLELIRSGEGAFLRGVLRTLTRERLALGYGRNQPFELRYNNLQQLWLTDQATGTALLLNAFGAENTASFAKLLHSNGVTGS